MDLVPHTRFSTQNLPGQNRFDVWRDSISVLFRAEQEKNQRHQPFYAQLDAFMLDHIMIARTRSREAQFIRSPDTIRKDGIDIVMLQMFLQGNIHFRYKNDRHTHQAGDIVVYDLNRECHLHNSDFEHLSILFPRELIDEIIPSASLWHGRALPSACPMTRLLKSHILSLYEFGPQITTQSCQQLQHALLNLTSSAFQASASNLAKASDVIAATQLREIKKYIQRHLHNPQLSPESIAAALGFSRAQLYRISEPLEGISQYIRRQRLKRCMAELKNPNPSANSLTEISLKWGFNDTGTFTRNFKQTFGILPKDARHQARQEQRAALCSDKPTRLDTRHHYEDWIRSLTH